ncbi:MAG: hypothetical protein ACI9WU_000911 [Myxococcota bacterium]|jgi:hypothetical protein
MRGKLIGGACALALVLSGCATDDKGATPAKKQVPASPSDNGTPQKPSPKPAAVPPSPAAPEAAAPKLSREDYNRLAVLHDAGIFWREDTDNNRLPDDSEVTRLHGNADLDALYRSFSEARRREAVASELNQGRATLVSTDFAKLTTEDRAVMKHLAKAAVLIDELYQQQTGALALAAKIPADDAPSRAVFRRNQGPGCEAPTTSDDPFCNATPTFETARSFAWPVGPTLDKAFCDMIGKQPNARELMDPFHVVRADGDGYKAVPYTEVYGDRMKQTAKALRAAAAALKSEDEAPFKAYLSATADGFETNKWWAADEAWSRMNARNSRWYLRIGPDETYFDPCQVKSGFHMSLARVDRSALEWQDKLTQKRSDMEKALAAAIGAPYAAREVQFQLPEFIEIIINAGDSRSGQGATIGQSLPNFGPVAEESRGRTVAMANLYTDPTSMAVARKRAESLFSVATMRHFSDDPGAGRLDTVLHEATHNFGPTGSWKVDGKKPEEIFGGRLDAILEELKSQTGSFFFLYYLLDAGMLTDDQVKHGIVSSIAWAFGHISRGMFTSSGKPRTYSVLSGIQLHYFMKAGAIIYADGRFDIVFDKMRPAVNALMKEVGGLKARGDRPAAEKLMADATNDAALKFMRVDTIRERVLRFPKASFVYSVGYE